ncbi:MAG TPA: hypothetical protein VFR81_18245 [Longimicrobium sp.]|nr:hypothetical protein [Longimicrobium sp.]
MPLRSIAAAVAAALALVGCGDLLGLGSADPDAVGSLSFQYSGARTGAFRARGPVPAEMTGSYAASYESFDDLTLSAFHATSGGRGDYVVLASSILEPGETATACLGGGPPSPRCFIGTVVFNLDPNDPDGPGRETYLITEGRLRVTAKSSTGIRGEFSGTAVGGNGTRIVITGGFFDAPQRPDAPVLPD